MLGPGPQGSRPLFFGCRIRRVELNKKYTRLQNLRKMRAEDKGVSRQLAVELRKTAAWLAKQEPDELPRPQIKDLQLAAYMTILIRCSFYRASK
jgi:hypothetical protein